MWKPSWPPLSVCRQICPTVIHANTILQLQTNTTLASNRTLAWKLWCQLINLLCICVYSHYVQLWDMSRPGTLSSLCTQAMLELQLPVDMKVWLQSCPQWTIGSHSCEIRRSSRSSFEHVPYQHVQQPLLSQRARLRLNTNLTIIVRNAWRNSPQCQVTDGDVVEPKLFWSNLQHKLSKCVWMSLRYQHTRFYCNIYKDY